MTFTIPLNQIVPNSVQAATIKSNGPVDDWDCLDVEESYYVDHGTDPDDDDYLFRYYDSTTGKCIICQPYLIQRRTPKGYWIKDHMERERLIVKPENDLQKRFAYPNRRLAWESYKIRKTRQITHLKNMLNHVEQCKIIAERERP